jgi:tetratricopeptide (TPR) repeat protein
MKTRNIMHKLLLMASLFYVTLNYNCCADAYDGQLNSLGKIDNWGHYDTGLKQIERKDFKQAENEFNFYFKNADVLAHMAGVAHFGRGLMFQAQGNIGQAIAEFKLAAKNDLHPDVKITDKAYMNIGAIYLRKKAYQEAIQAYSQAVGNNPQNGLAHFYLGMSYLSSGDYEKAEKEGDEAKKLGVPYTGISDGLAERKNPQAKSKEVTAQQMHKKSKKVTKKKIVE